MGCFNSLNKKIFHFRIKKIKIKIAHHPNVENSLVAFGSRSAQLIQIAINEFKKTNKIKVLEKIKIKFLCKLFWSLPLIKRKRDQRILETKYSASLVYHDSRSFSIISVY